MNGNPPTPLMEENKLEGDILQDLGELGVPQQDRIYDTQDTEARHKEAVTTHTGLVEKMLGAAIERGIVTSAWAESYILPNRETSLGDLRRSLTDTNNALNAHELGENPDSNTSLREKRAQLVTEIIYTVTALLEKALSELANKINNELSTENTTAAKKSVEDLSYFEPQWTALTKNTDTVITDYRKQFSEAISADHLGKLNDSLYLALDLKDNLPSDEKLPKGGTLVEIMSQIGSWLTTTIKKQNDATQPQPVEALTVSSVEQKTTGPATAEPSTSPITTLEIPPQVTQTASEPRAPEPPTPPTEAPPPSTDTSTPETTSPAPEQPAAITPKDLEAPPNAPVLP